MVADIRTTPRERELLENWCFRTALPSDQNAAAAAAAARAAAATAAQDASSHLRITEEQKRKAASRGKDLEQLLDQVGFAPSESGSDFFNDVLFDIPWSDHLEDLFLEEPMDHQVPSCDYCGDDTYNLGCSVCQMRFCDICQQRPGVVCQCEFDKIPRGPAVFMAAKSRRTHKDEDNEEKLPLADSSGDEEGSPASKLRAEVPKRRVHFDRKFATKKLVP